MRRALALLVVSLTALAACGGDSGTAPVQVGVEDSGSAVDLEVGQQLRVSLASNPTTGYEWVERPSADPAVLELLESTYVQDEADAELVGSGGTQVFVYEAVAAGRAGIALAYLREFEDGSTVDEFTLDVTVE